MGWVKLIGAALLALASTGAAAQARPQKPVRLIVPFPPRGAPRLSARLLRGERGVGPAPPPPPPGGSGAPSLAAEARALHRAVPSRRRHRHLGAAARRE